MYKTVFSCTRQVLPLVYAAMLALLHRRPQSDYHQHRCHQQSRKDLQHGQFCRDLQKNIEAGGLEDASHVPIACSPSFKCGFPDTLSKSAVITLVLLVLLSPETFRIFTIPS